MLIIILDWLVNNQGGFGPRRKKSWIPMFSAIFLFKPLFKVYSSSILFLLIRALLSIFIYH